MSLDNLPVEWFETTFENVISNISNGIGGKQNKESIGIPVTRIETIAHAKIDFDKIGFIPEPNKKDVEKYKLNKGDILFSHINSPIHLGKTAIFEHDSTLYHGINLLRIVVDHRIINYKFFNYFCNLIRSEGVFSLNAQHAVNQSSINQKKLNSFRINLAPLAEQQEIVRQLDVMLAQVEQIKARLDAIPAILKKFRQSVLADAVSGKLTEDWRSVNPILESASETKEKWLAQRREKFNEQYPKKKFKEPSLVDDKYMPWDEIPNEWDLVSVSEFAECLDNLRVPIKKDDRNSNEGLYPYFGANGEVDRVDEFIIDDDIVLVTEDETFYGRTKPIAYRYYGKCWVNNHVHVLKAPTREANDYLCYALMYYHVIPWLTGTTGRAKLSQAALNSLPLLMPPVKEIEVIVVNVNKLLERAEKIENVIQSAQKRVNLLTQSILAKAFSGELTAEWRQQHQELITGVNSAESLLAKIQEEREASKPAKKTRKKKEV